MQLTLFFNIYIVYFILYVLLCFCFNIELKEISVYIIIIIYIYYLKLIISNYLFILLTVLKLII